MYETPLDMGTSKMVKKQKQKKDCIIYANLILFKMKKEKQKSLIN